MLTYKKLLPQGIIGRRTLSNASNTDEDESEQESNRSQHGSSSGSYYDDADPDMNGGGGKLVQFETHPPFTLPESGEHTKARIDDSRLATKDSTSQAGSDQAHHGRRRPINIKSSISNSTGYFTSVTTMTDNVRSENFLTRDVIDESRYLSRKKAPGMTKKEFPLRSQSSGFSHASSLETERNSSSGTVGTTTMSFSPLKLSRVYGRNDKIPVLNLTGIHYSHVVYSASNVIVLFDFYNNKQRMLQGHKNKITCLGKDSQNTHFASGDVGPGSVIIIWDISTGYPFRTFPVSHGDGDYGVISLAFVGTEEYIGSIGNEMRYSADDKPKTPLHYNTVRHDDDGSSDGPVVKEKKAIAEEKQNICIWHLSHHEHGPPHTTEHHHHHERAGGKPAAVFAIPSFVGHQREIVFCDDQPEYFVTTGDRCVVFYTWLRHAKLIAHHVPKRSMKFMSKMNKFTQSIWMKHTNWCLTGTDVGYIVAWATPVPLGLQSPPDPKLNIKEYKRSYKVGDCSVTALISHKDLFIVGDENGVVKFFDTKFRILRWTKLNLQFALQPITCISCNQCEGPPEFKKEMQEHFDKRRDNKELVKDWTYGGQKFRQPSQATIERPAFFAPDFIVGCQGGDAHYCHLAEAKSDQIVFGTPGHIVAMDTCPNTTHVTTSTKDGHIQMFDYTTNTLIFSGSVFKKLVEVSCMKFHPQGSYAFFGMRNGQLYFRRAYTWKSMEAPLDNCTSCVERIIFTVNGAYMAHYDTSYVVTLYVDNVQRNTWVLKGKHRSHYRPIVDLMFFRDELYNKERLFSLGQDKYIIEYDIYTSTQATGLKILYRYPIDTQFIPTSMAINSPWKNHKPILLIANTGNKLRFFDQDIKEVKRYCQGPTYGTAVTRMLTVRPELQKGRGSEFILMTLGNKVGLMKTPVDGNPFKYMAVLGHPEGIHEIAIGCSGKEVFTSGHQDDCLLQWVPNVSALETCVLSGGFGVTPYLKMLDAGLPPGRSLAEDVENIFYHLLIRRAKNQQDMLSMKLEIPIIDIPLVLRACGTFLTEYQHELMLEEAIELGEVRDGEPPKMITFEDFVRLFSNYKEFPPVMEDEVVEAFHVLGELNEDEELFISREKFLDYISMHGEKIHVNQLPYFLPTLYQSKEEIPVFEDTGPPAWFDLVDTEDQQEALGFTSVLHMATSAMALEQNPDNPQNETATDLENAIPVTVTVTVTEAEDNENTTNPANILEAILEKTPTNENLSLPVPANHDGLKPPSLEIRRSQGSGELLKSLQQELKSGLKTDHGKAGIVSDNSESAKSSQRSGDGGSDGSSFYSCSGSGEGEDESVDYTKLQFGRNYSEEDVDAEPINPEFIDKELPEEITLEYFLEEIVPIDAVETIAWIPPSKDEKKELDNIYDREPDRTTWNDVLERWRYRDEWRYFRGTFSLMRRDDVSFVDKLSRVVEMDHYCRKGFWPGQEPSDETEEGEEDEFRRRSSRGSIQPQAMEGSGSSESSGSYDSDDDESEEDEDEDEDEEEENSHKQRHSIARKSILAGDSGATDHQHHRKSKGAAVEFDVRRKSIKPGEFPLDRKKSMKLPEEAWDQLKPRESLMDRKKSGKPGEFPMHRKQSSLKPGEFEFDRRKSEHNIHRASLKQNEEDGEDSHEHHLKTSVSMITKVMSKLSVTKKHSKQISLEKVPSEVFTSEEVLEPSEEGAEE